MLNFSWENFYLKISDWRETLILSFIKPPLKCQWRGWIHNDKENGRRQWTDERFLPESVRWKVARGLLITVEGGVCSQRSGKQPVCPAEPWRAVDITRETWCGKLMYYLKNEEENSTSYTSWLASWALVPRQPLRGK